MDGLKKLREPFPAHQIGKLAKGTKAQTQCPADEKRNCSICGGWHHPKMIHLDYVGHAALTDRLLDSDPSWSWEPLALRDGLPAYDSSGGLWIKLTVCGVTRLGYGNAPESEYKEIGSRDKEVIGDALRNAAMRFGAALELWHKGQLHEEEPKESKLGGSVGSQVLNSIRDPLTEAQKRHVEDNLKHIIAAYEAGGPQGGFERIEQEDFDDMQKIYLGGLMESKVRNAITTYSRQFHSKKPEKSHA